MMNFEGLYKCTKYIDIHLYYVQCVKTHLYFLTYFMTENESMARDTDEN